MKGQPEMVRWSRCITVNPSESKCCLRCRPGPGEDPVSVLGRLSKGVFKRPDAMGRLPKELNEEEKQKLSWMVARQEALLR